MRQMLVLGLLTASASMPALADYRDDGDRYEDRARVVSVTPQYQRVNTPRQECHTEYVRESYYEQRERSPGGAILGGITGGLLGSTIGRGGGRVAAAAVGAGIGAVVGDRIDNGNGPRGRERVETRPVESCVAVDNWQNVPAGYVVNYEYNGRQYSTVTDRDPGRYIPVRVEVRPSGYVSDVVYREPRGEWREYDRRRRHDYW